MKRVLRVQSSLVCLLFSFLSVTSALADCVTPPSGLISWWRAEGTAADASSANSGTLYNGVTFPAGEVSQAFALNTSGAHVRVPDAANLHFTTALTIEAWVYPAVHGNFHGIVSKWETGLGGQNSYALQLQPDGLANFTVCSDGANGVTFITSSNAVALSQWTHLAATYDGSALRIYVNGALQKQLAYAAGIFPGSHDLGIGGTVGGAPAGQVAYSFVGSIDEPSLYNRALSGAEIQGIYAAGNAGKCGSPTAPVILTQPASVSVRVGDPASFNPTVVGTPPLSYQWQHDGTDIPGATSNNLALSNVQLSDAGNYSFVVSNAAGNITSSNAALTVTTPPPCLTPPAGLVSWWRANGDATDSVSGNSGTLYNSATFGAGEVNQAFSLNGTTAHVRVPDAPSLHFTSALTIESWIYPTARSSFQNIVSKWDAGGGGQNSYSLQLQPDGLANLTITPNGGSTVALITSTNPVPLNQWTHLTGTYDGSALRIYVNGVLQKQIAYNQGIFPGHDDLGIGGTVGGVAAGQVAYTFPGLIDEASLYSRALTDSEIQNIYAIGSGGKCNQALPPSIVAQPGNQTAVVGANVTFAAGAGGTPPLSYQWTHQTANITDATNSFLSISNVQLSDAGGYALVVTNLYGSVTSATATLTVTLPPALVRAGSVSGASSAAVTVPVTIVANGNENAVGLSLSYSPSLLSFVSASAGSGVSGAAFLFNTNTAGRVGLAIALSTGTTLPAGTQEVAEVTFMTAVVTNATTTPVGMTDVPVSRQVTDVNGQSLPATFFAGSVSIAPAEFEADVFPRPGGDRKVNLSDWVLIGRYVAQLDSPTNNNEFQRADCAPRSTKGDGQLSIADWVQAGRYAAGLDPLSVLGGPDSPGPVPPPTNGKLDLGRNIQATDNQLLPGQSVTVSILLNSQGNENAMGFTLGFNPNALRFVSAVLGSNASGSTLNVNTNQVASGALGLALAKSFGTSFNSGTDEVIKVTFNASSTAAGAYPITFNDQIVRREVSDPNASVLSSTYSPGTVTVNPPPTLSISVSGTNILLSWPAAAGDFGLQQATDILVPTWTPLSASTATNNNQISTSIPLGTGPKFYRLAHP